MNRRLVPLLIPLALVAAACGQKSGVAGTAADGDAVVAPTAVTQPAATTTVAPPAGGSTAPAPSGPAGTGATTSEAPVASEAPATTAAPAGPYTPGPNDTSGVTDDEIVIGIHAPVTGASPIPQTSFETGKDIYWQFLAANAPETLFGRTVRVVFRDDTFNPQTAVQVCREMVEQEGAFLLVGAGGADQITACAQYADQNGVPYLSAGVNETGLADLSTYFALSPTYAEQAGALVAELQRREITNIGLVVSDTPSFEDAYEAIDAAAEEAGLTIVYDHRLSKEPAEAETLSVVQELKGGGAEAVILLSSPLAFIGLAGQGVNQSFAPIWLGPGVTSGLNAVTNFGCPGVETGEFFSPYPGLDVVDQLDPDFTAAYGEFGGGQPADDIGLGLWGLNKVIGTALAASGEELGRAAFLNTLVTTPSFETGLYAPVAFTPEDHFGGTAVHLLAADCAIKQYTTAEQFVDVTA